jgi:Rrf2 family protein
MSKPIALSEAVSIGIHGMILIAASKIPVNVVQIAKQSGTSRHHVAKIMQRLNKEGFLLSTRGPAGGFILSKPADTISFLEIYEAIEGKLEIPACPMDKKVCPFNKCITDNIMSRLSLEFKKFLEEHTLGAFLEDNRRIQDNTKASD